MRGTPPREVAGLSRLVIGGALAPRDQPLYPCPYRVCAVFEFLEAFGNGGGGLFEAVRFDPGHRCAEGSFCAWRAASRLLPVKGRWPCERQEQECCDTGAQRSDRLPTVRRFPVDVEPAEFAVSVLPPSSTSGVGELEFHGDATNAREEPEGSLFPNTPEGLDLLRADMPRVELGVPARCHPEQGDVGDRSWTGVENLGDGDEPVPSDIVFRRFPFDRPTGQRGRARGTGFRFVDDLERDTGFRHIDAFSLRTLVRDALTVALLRFELTGAVFCCSSGDASSAGGAFRSPQTPRGCRRSADCSNSGEPPRHHLTPHVRHVGIVSVPCRTGTASAWRTGTPRCRSGFLSELSGRRSLAASPSGAALQWRPTSSSTHRASMLNESLPLTIGTIVATGQLAAPVTADLVVIAAVSAIAYILAIVSLLGAVRAARSNRRRHSAWLKTATAGELDQH